MGRKEKKKDEAHLPPVLDRKVKRKPRNPLRLLPRHDLQRLNHTRGRLVLQARVLALGVLANDGKVDVAVTGRETRDRLAQDDGGVDVELLTHGDVPGSVAGALERGVKDTCDEGKQAGLAKEGRRVSLVLGRKRTLLQRTLEPDLVPPERVHRALEKRRILRGVARDGELLKLDGDVGVLEDLLDRLGDLLADTVTGDQGDLDVLNQLQREGEMRRRVRGEWAGKGSGW